MVLQPERAFEIEIVGRLVEQQQVGLREQRCGERHAHAPAAGEFRARPLLVGGWRSQGRRGSMPRGQGPRARRYRRAGSGFRRCDAGRARSRPRPAARCARDGAFSTTSSRLSGPFGASCASRPMRQRGGISTWPCSAEISPAMTPNKRGLAGAVAADQADARAGRNARGGAFQQVRPAMRTVRSSMMSMPRLLADSAARSNPSLGKRRRRSSFGQ